VSDGPSGSDVVVMPTAPPLLPAGLVGPPSPPAEATPSSPWIDAPLAPVSWRLGGAVLDLVLIVCTVAVGWLAWWIIVWDSGHSPAKSVLHMRVVRADTRSLPSFGRMALREAVGKGIPGAACLIGLAMLGDGGAARFLVAAPLAWFAMSAVAALFDDNRRTLWDVFARTIVVLDADVAPERGDDAAIKPAAEEGTAPT
jgi:uncharacterized RDD family membrane protein YckC